MSTERNTRFTFKGPMRRDGKYPVRIVYPGAPNMFGGYYHDTVYNKLFTAEKCIEYIDKPWISVVNCPPELKRSVS